MKHKLLFLAFIAFIPFYGMSQNDPVDGDSLDGLPEFLVPNYDFLRQVTSDKTSKYYYPLLLKRFLAVDTSLTIEDVHCLYYGYVLQDNYDPYIHLDEEDGARKLLNQENVSKRIAKKALKLLDKAIEKAPMHLRLYMYRHYANTVLYGQDSRQADEDGFHYVALISAIAASGDGSNYSNAFHVAVVSHAYNLMSYYGFNVVAQSLSFDSLHNSYDIYDVEENEYGVENLYFNITPCFSHLSKMFSSSEYDSDAGRDTILEEIDFPVGTRTVVKLEPQKKEDIYRFRVLEQSPYTDIVSYSESHNILPSEGEENTIHFYCVKGENDKVFLIIKSFCKETLSYDSYIRYVGNSEMVSTSNSGIFPKVNMVEIWNDPLQSVRVSRLRQF